MRPRHLALFAFLMVSAGCRTVPVVPYHTEPIEGGGCAAETSDCSAAFLEEREEYLLGFVEFDDLGWAHDRRQQTTLLERIGRELEERDVLMVVFAHGWKHNSESCDSNVTCFRTILEQLHATEKAVAAPGAERRIVGIYVGWRGLSWDTTVSRQLTFYGRKATAHKVGSGAVTELLVRLKQLREERHRSVTDSDTRLVIVGHSFGGALIWSATSQLLMERMAVARSLAEGAPDDDSAAEEIDCLRQPLPGDAVRGFGDLVLLVNPAFEAARYQPLHALSQEGSFPTCQPPIFVVATSTGDDATGKWFPRGRALSVRLDDYPPGKVQLEREANLRTLGHFKPYNTHALTATDRTPKIGVEDKAKIASCDCPFDLGSAMLSNEDPGAVRERATALRRFLANGESEFPFPTSELVWKGGPLPSNAPVMVVEVDPKIIPNHVDIYQPAFIDFLRHLIMAAGARPAHYDR